MLFYGADFIKRDAHRFTKQGTLSHDQFFVIECIGEMHPLQQQEECDALLQENQTDKSHQVRCEEVPEYDCVIKCRIHSIRLRNEKNQARASCKSFISAKRDRYAGIFYCRAEGFLVFHREAVSPAMEIMRYRMLKSREIMTTCSTRRMGVSWRTRLVLGVVIVNS